MRIQKLNTRNKRELEGGQGLVEYAIIIALVGLVASVVVGLIGLAASRSYGLTAGALGVKRDVQTAQNYIHFDDTKPWCGNVGVTKVVYAQFWSDIDKQFLTVSTDIASVNPEIQDYVAAVGIGNYLLTATLPTGASCPTSL